MSTQSVNINEISLWTSKFDLHFESQMILILIEVIIFAPPHSAHHFPNLLASSFLLQMTAYLFDCAVCSITSADSLCLNS